MRSITKLTLLGFRLAVVLLAAYWVMIAVGTHLPVTLDYSPKWNDKWKHFLAYAGLTFLLCYVTNSRRLVRRFATIAAVVLVYAAIDELTQAFIPKRVPDRYDFLADACGMTTVLIPYALASHWIRKTSFKSPISLQRRRNGLV